MTGSSREQLEAIIGRKMAALLGDEPIRLRRALEVVRLLYVSYDRRVVQAWLMGLNPKLDDQSPMRLLRDGDEAAFRAVLDAARAEGYE